LIRDDALDPASIAERWTMPNLYFIQCGNAGMLRAVLSREEGSALLRRHAADYAGREFPEAAESNCALLRIFDEEADKAWRAGFYRFAADVMQIEQALRESLASRSKPQIESKQAKSLRQGKKCDTLP
jgi:hypothetical protein